MKRNSFENAFRYFIDGCQVMFVTGLMMMVTSLLFNLVALIEGSHSNFTMLVMGEWISGITGGILFIFILIACLTMRKSVKYIVKILQNALKTDIEKLSDYLAN